MLVFLLLKERKIKSVEEMTQLAVQYIEAHGIGDTMPKVSQGGKFEGKFEITKVSLPRAVGSENFNQFKLRDKLDTLSKNAQLKLTGDLFL